jgi:hypothetical protein
MPKRVPPLSVRTLGSVRPGDKPIELVDGYVPGLRVRVLPSGTRAWSLNIRDSIVKVFGVALTLARG